MRKKSIPGKNIFYYTEEEGIPMVLLHGFCEDHRVWSNQTGCLDGYKLIIPDLPGFGKSASPETMSMEYMADIVKDIIEQENAGKVIMVGHSMGGYVTLAFAELYPELLYGFGLFHSTAYGDDEEKKSNRVKTADFIRENGMNLFVRTFVPNLFSPGFSDMNVIRKVQEIALACPVNGVVAGLDAMRERPDRSNVLKDSKVPVLLIAGRHDAIIPLDKMLLQSSFPAVSSVHILENSGHEGMLEEPEMSNNILSDFGRFCSTAG